MKPKSTFLFLAIALFANINIGNAQVNVQDSLALVDLYNNTNGQNLFCNRNWLTKNPVSTWCGINVTGIRVTGIDLGTNNLNGSIPSSIGNLIKLSGLFLYNNPLSGNIP